MLPDFLILGLPRTGTTSMHLALKKHPGICIPLEKETWFFNGNYHKGVKWYEERFWHCPSNSKVGEVSTTIFLQDDFAQRLKKVIPHSKLIVLLRDPIERGYSHYLHNVRIGFEKLDFKQALECEPAKIAERPHVYNLYGYSGIGANYKKNIEQLFSIFPKKQIRVFLLEEFEQSGQKTLSFLFDFIGVNHSVDNFPRVHVARVPRNRRLQKLLDIPYNFFYRAHKKYSTANLIPLSLERRFRHLRANMVSILRAISESGQRKINKPPIPSETRKNMENFYNRKLCGLDLLIGKELSNYWPWFSEGSLPNR